MKWEEIEGMMTTIISTRNDGNSGDEDDNYFDAGNDGNGGDDDDNYLNAGNDGNGGDDDDNDIDIGNDGNDLVQSEQYIPSFADKLSISRYFPYVS